MAKVTISIREKKQPWGRVDYYPLCDNAFYILSFAKGRLTFSKKNIEEMKALGWKLDIKQEKNNE